MVIQQMSQGSLLGKAVKSHDGSGGESSETPTQFHIIKQRYGSANPSKRRHRQRMTKVA